MERHEAHAHDPVKSSRFKTGAVLLGGLLLLGFGLGLAAGHSGIGTILGAGTWLTVLGAIRVARGL